MLDKDSADGLLSATVYDADDNKVGRVGRVYLDDRSGQPAWVTVQTGLFGTKESFLPLGEARLDGERLIVPIDKNAVKGAPHIDPDAGHLSVDEERQLYEYYGMSDGDGDRDNDGLGDQSDPSRRSAADLSGDSGADRDRIGADRSDAGGPDSPRDTSSPTMAAAAAAPVPMSGTSATPASPTPYATPDDSSSSPASGQSDPAGAGAAPTDEQGQRSQSGMRLRRHLVTEEQQITVPVVREEYILEPDPDASGGMSAGRDDEPQNRPPAR